MLFRQDEDDRHGYGFPAQTRLVRQWWSYRYATSFAGSFHPSHKPAKTNGELSFRSSTWFRCASWYNRRTPANGIRSIDVQRRVVLCPRVLTRIGSEDSNGPLPGSRPSSALVPVVDRELAKTISTGWGRMP